MSPTKGQNYGMNFLVMKKKIESQILFQKRLKSKFLVMESKLSKTLSF